MKMVDDRFVVESLALVASGWAWAIRADSLTDRYSYGEIEKPFTDVRKAMSGVFLTINREGVLEFEYGKLKPEDRTAKKAPKADKKAKGESTEEPAVVSQALSRRLTEMLRDATMETLIVVGKSAGGLTRALSAIVVAQLDANFTVQQSEPEIRKHLPAKTFNEILAEIFDADDYFASTSKPLLIAAIKDVGLFEQAKAITKRAELAKFAVAHIAKTGWLPQELRTPHYVKPDKTKGQAKAAATKAAKKSKK